MPTGTVDRASVHIPSLLYERMDELGLDFSVLYPSLGLTLSSIQDEDIRRLACRVFNRSTAELFAPYADRFTPVATIPMFTCAEALDELEYVVGTLGAKAVALGTVRRPVPKVAREWPEAARWTLSMDTFGLDSEEDYDPFWRRAQELRVPLGVHHSEQGYSSWRSTSRYVFNHIGGFAGGVSMLCKAIFMGGVTRRFPQLRFAFLEGGVGWAAIQLADIVGHWEKRNKESILSLDPTTIDVAAVTALVEQYAPDSMKGKQERIATYFARQNWRPADLDDFRACEIESVEDIATLFIDPFFFGCEADTPLNPLAFDTRYNPFGRPLQSIFGSDFGHWDVPDMSGVVHEAYEAVDEGLVTPAQFSDFTFGNPIRMLAGANPDFFVGTRVETAVKEFLVNEGTAPPVA
jgi:predicted TIM-barrel fold metal-dependent hydrolase